jgi:adenylate cyclase
MAQRRHETPEPKSATVSSAISAASAVEEAVVHGGLGALSQPEKGGRASPRSPIGYAQAGTAQMRAFSRLRERRWPLRAVAVGIGLGVGAIVWGSRAAGWLAPIEFGAYDLFVRWHGSTALPDSRVVLLRIREQEIEAYGHPIPDAVLARALRRLSGYGPRAIGVDLYRAPPGAASGHEAWDALAATILGNPRIVALEKLPQHGEPGVPPPSFLAGGDQVGFSDLAVDPDGTVRRGLLFLWDEEERPSLSLSLQLALRYLADVGLTLAADPDDPERVRLGETTIAPLGPDDGSYVDADAGGYQYLLDFRRGAEAFPAWSLSQLLAGEIDPSSVEGRVVLLGTTAPSVKDDFRTAHSGGRFVSGIDLHAHAVDQLLRTALEGEAPMSFWSEPAEVAWLLAWSLLGALLGIAFRSPLGLTAATAASLGVLIAGAFALFRMGFWVPLVPPGLATASAAGLVVAEVARRERAERAIVMDLFGRYVSRNVADELWKRRGEFMDGQRPRSRRLMITALLTDLKGYTSAAEKLDPAALMDWVNGYMAVMTEIVEAHGGFVDDYTGDGIKANFGVPLSSASEPQIGEDARAAVRCAVAMGEALSSLDAEWRARGLPSARMRVGVFTGEAVAGSLGSARRMKYTTVGDTVNTAARLESFRKEEFESEPESRSSAALFRILIGDSTHRHLGDEFETECLGGHSLRGRSEPITIYRVWGRRRPAGGEGGAT